MERLFWPDLFVLGGGVSKLSQKFMPYLHLKTEVIPAKLLNQAGIVGAALYAAEKTRPGIVINKAEGLSCGFKDSPSSV